MKKFTKLFLILTVILLVVGCSKGKVETPPEKGDVITPQDQTQVLQDIKKLIETDLEIKLPQELPILETEYLTAVIKSDKDSYSVNFYKNKEPLKLNDESIINGSSSAVEIAALKVEKKATQEEANMEVPFEDFSKMGAQEVDLGYKITGYQDAAVGSLFTSWNKGEWAIATRSLTAESEKGVELAKKAVEYLEKNTLPTVDPHGNIHLDTEGNGNLAKWQEKEVIYVLDQVKDSMDMLKMIVSFK